MAILKIWYFAANPILTLWTKGRHSYLKALVSQKAVWGTSDTNEDVIIATI